MYLNSTLLYFSGLSTSCFNRCSKWAWSSSFLRHIWACSFISCAEGVNLCSFPMCTGREWLLGQFQCRLIIVCNTQLDNALVTIFTMSCVFECVWWVGDHFMWQVERGRLTWPSRSCISPKRKMRSGLDPRVCARSRSDRSDTHSGEMWNTCFHLKITINRR